MRRKMKWKELYRGLDHTVSMRVARTVPVRYVSKGFRVVSVPAIKS